MPIYMNYDKLSVKGNVSAEGHKDWIEASSLQFGVGRGISSPVGNTANRESSSPSVSEVTLSKEMDNASPKLFNAALRGQAKEVVIEFTRTQKDKLETFLTYTLHDTMVSGYSVSSGGDRPSESLSLNFTKIEMKYIPMDETGANKDAETIMYDLTKAKAG